MSLGRKKTHSIRYLVSPQGSFAMIIIRTEIPKRTFSHLKCKKEAPRNKHIRQKVLSKFVVFYSLVQQRRRGMWKVASGLRYRTMQPAARLTNAAIRQRPGSPKLTRDPPTSKKNQTETKKPKNLFNAELIGCNNATAAGGGALWKQRSSVRTKC